MMTSSADADPARAIPKSLTMARAVFLEQDVVRLHVAMNDAAAVGVAESQGHVMHQLRERRRRERAARTKPLAERLPANVRHHEVRQPFGLSDAMDRHDVRMRQAGGGPGLAHESIADICPLDERSRQHLDGDETVELNFAGEIDYAHAASADFAFDRILTGERAL